MDILAIIKMVDAVMGSDSAKALLDLVHRRTELTSEQKANLDANYRDYVERIARLRAEQSQ